MTVTDEPAPMLPVSAEPAGESRRLTDARSRAAQRLGRQRQTLRPLGVAVMLAVAVATASTTPRPGLTGRSVGVTLALIVFVATVVIAIRDRFPQRSAAVQAAVILAMGIAAVALSTLQSRGATGLAAGAAVWMANTRLAPPVGIAITTAVTMALDVGTLLAGASGGSVVAATIFCVLLGLIAHFVKQAREAENRAEVLLAQLEDARDEQARAAAIAERGRIASELHDVLAHTLSGAAIQLQGARMLAGREQAGCDVRGAIDRAADLVREGLVNARHAVGALRGDLLPGVDELGVLVESFRRDLNVDATLRIEGVARTLPADAGVALYRGAQEALTNTARYAPGACVVVVLHYRDQRTTLTVEDRRAGAGPSVAGLEGVGGGRGLSGMRERVHRAGGTMQAGPTASGWRVDLEVPG